MTDLAPSPPEQKEVGSNQTVFGSEEPLFERSQLPSAPVKKTDDADSTAKPQPALSQNKKIILAIGAFVILLLLLVTVGMQPQKRVQQLLYPAVSPSPRPEQTALQQRVTEVGTDLQAADPTQNDLTFPPIEKNIYLDKPQQ